MRVVINLNRKKNFEILTNFTQTRFFGPTSKLTCEIAKFCDLATINANSESLINSLKMTYSFPVNSRAVVT